MKNQVTDNKKSDLRKLSSYINYIVLLKYIPLCVFFSLPFTHPHIHRQSDTMGVTIRYFFKIFSPTEGSQFFHHKFLPAILQSGDLQGIMPMEFPLLNLILSPFFIIFDNHFWGMYLSRFALFFLSVFIWRQIYLKLKEKEFLGVPVGLSLKVMLIATLLAQYLVKFIPDVFSFLLCLWGFAFLLGEKKINKKLFLKSNLLITLGLLIKPTSIIVFVPLLVPVTLKKIILYSKVFFLPIAMTLVYYLKGSSYLLSLSDFEPLFKTKFRSPVRNLVTFFEDFSSFIEFFSQNLFFPFCLLFFVGFYGLFQKRLDKSKIKSLLTLFSILLFQIFFIILIDGSHALRHHYYFLGTSFIAAIILTFLIQHSSNMFSYVILGSLFIWGLEKNIYSLKPLFKQNHWKECSTLIESHPSIFSFKKQKIFSNFEEKYPHLGLCFGIRSNALKSEYFLSKKVETLPPECETIDQTEQLVISKCPNLKLEYGN
ncbi:hypothetical protein N9N67_08485 [Bacteriovoracaceae bacterium]|nr:hypothetical protein [Bacteriovoracaceae bacterium]